MTNREIILEKIKYAFENSDSKLRIWKIDTNIFNMLNRFKNNIEMALQKKYNKCDLEKLNNGHITIKYNGKNSTINKARYHMYFFDTIITPTANKEQCAWTTISQYIKILFNFNFLMRFDIKELNIHKNDRNLELNIGKNYKMDWRNGVAYSIAMLGDKSLLFYKKNFSYNYKHVLAYSLLIFYYYQKYEYGYDDIKDYIRAKKSNNQINEEEMKDIYSTYKGIDKFFEEETIVEIIQAYDNEPIIIDQSSLQKNDEYQYTWSTFMERDLKKGNIPQNIKNIIYREIQNQRQEFSKKLRKRVKKYNVHHELNIDYKRNNNNISIESCEAAHILAVHLIRAKINLELRDNPDFDRINKLISMVGDPNNGFMSPIEFHKGFDKGYYLLDTSTNFNKMKKEELYAKGFGWVPGVKLVDYLQTQHVKDYITKVQQIDEW